MFLRSFPPIRDLYSYKVACYVTIVYETLCTRDYSLHQIMVKKIKTM